MYAYAANNPVRYIDPDGRVEKEISPIDDFLSNADDITAFVFAVCEAVAHNEEAAIPVISQKFNELGIVDGVIVGFLPGKGDLSKCAFIKNTANKFSNIFRGLTIAIQAIDVIIVYRKTGGDSDTVTKRFIRNSITTSGELLCGKFGAAIGAKFGGSIGGIVGGIIGGSIGGIGAVFGFNYFINDYFDEIGW